MRAGFNKNLSALERERYEASLNPAAMVPTTPPSDTQWAPTVHRTEAQKLRRRQLQFQLRVQRANGGVDSLTALKARFADYLLNRQTAPATVTATPEETENSVRVIPGVTLEKDRLHHRWLGPGCWCGGRCA
jgi:hypothetical protein